MKEVKKVFNKWGLFDPEHPEKGGEAIHALQYEPDPEEIYSTYIIYEGGAGNSPILNLAYGSTPDTAIQTAIEEMNINPEHVTGIEQVKVIHTTPPSEQLTLDNSVKDIFKKALNDAAADYGVINTSVKITHEANHFFNIEVRPTQISFLFNLFRLYGEYYYKHINEIK